MIKCRICNGNLTFLLSLGNLYISDFLNKNEKGKQFPLEIAKCTQCGLIQLADNVDLDIMYTDHYWYRSGLNKSMLKDLKNIVTHVESKIKLKPNDTVVDIGTNDGSLLSFYKEKNLFKVGFDPAPNLNEAAWNNCDLFINDYFKIDKFTYDKAKVITSIAMFYDLVDPNEFVQNIKKILHNDGIWVIQLTDLLSMLRVNAIDNICHEHLELYRLEDIINLVKKHGLEVFDVSYNNVNGGSIRIMISFPKKYKVSSLIKGFLHLEDLYLSIDNLNRLFNDVRSFKFKIHTFLKKYEGSIYGMAASTKGNTLLQLLRLDNNLIKAIGEVNKDKFGLVTSGTNIPIISEKVILKLQPKVIIIMAWHFESTFNKILKKYIKNGGLVLYPLPYPMVKTNKGDIYL